jgi:aryl-alcohol dehydrogenase-like predicted oxidoreductase
MARMEYRRLGDSGLVVSSFALGTMVFGEDSPRRADPEEAERMVRRFLDAGGNHVDTANVYAGGRSEEIVGKAIRGRRDQVVLATKVRFPMGDGPNDQGLGRVHLFREVEASLRRLDVDHVDLLYMHCWDPLTPIEESLEVFDELVRSGKVRYIGVSNFKAWQLMKALGVSTGWGWARFVAAQYQYSLVARDIEREFLDLCEAEGLGVVPWSPLGGGFLSGKYRPDRRPTDSAEGRLATQPDGDEEAWHRRATERNWRIIDAVSEVADEAGATMSQAALAWLLTRHPVASVIIGVRNLDQLEDNLGAAAVALSPDALARLDAVSALEPSYPYRFIEAYGSRSP